MTLRIDRCYCSDCTFAEIARAADETDAATVDDLREIIDFGANCKLCLPYVQEMLRTGETVFSRIIEASDADEAPPK